MSGGASEDPELAAEAEWAAKHPEEDKDKTNTNTTAATTEPPLLARQRSNSNERHRSPKPLTNGVVTVPRAQKNRRQTRSGRGRGETKKEGGGGKFTWGLAGKLYEEPAYLDPNDPNYDSDSQGNVTFDEVTSDSENVTAPKVRLETILKEYFASDDLEEAIALVKQAGLGESGRSQLVRSIVCLGAEGTGSCRELGSELLAELVARRVVYPADVARAFKTLLNAELEELCVDVPDAPGAVGAFLARAVADLALGAEFVGALERGAEKELSGAKAVEAVTRAAALLKQKSRLHDIWGVGGAFKPVRFLSRQMELLLQEYLGSGEVAEARHCLRELEVPHFHHELVYQAGLMSLEAMHETVLKSLAGLLRALAGSGDLSEDCLRQGFRRLYAALDDLAIDLPPAYTMAELWTHACMAFLPADIPKRLPRKGGRNRYVSESSDGRLKCISVAHPLI